MQKSHQKLSTLAALVVLGASAVANANNLKFRCDADPLNTDQARQRTAWAAKCHIISSAFRLALDAEGQYPTFLNITAPVDANAPCIDNTQLLGSCTVAGCYTPSQRVMFGQKYIPIGEAGQGETATVTALDDSWLLGDDLPLKEEAIGSFVVGEEHGDVLSISLENGMQLEVTTKHPMVDEYGKIVPARKIVAKVTKLLTTEGSSLVKSVTSRPYAGLVWNVEPVSTRTRANIHIAEGFVTGSVRYQNEWADDNARLNLRDTVDVSAF